MKSLLRKSFFVFLFLLTTFPLSAQIRSDEIGPLKAKVEQLQNDVNYLRRKIADLETLIKKMGNSSSNVSTKVENSSADQNEKVFAIKFSYLQITEDDYQIFSETMAKAGRFLTNVTFLSYTSGSRWWGYSGEIGSFSSYKEAYEFTSKLPKNATYEVEKKSDDRE